MNTDNSAKIILDPPRSRKTVVDRSPLTSLFSAATYNDTLDKISLYAKEMFHLCPPGAFILVRNPDYIKNENIEARHFACGLCKYLNIYPGLTDDEWKALAWPSVYNWKDPKNDTILAINHLASSIKHQSYTKETIDKFFKTYGHPFPDSFTYMIKLLNTAHKSKKWLTTRKIGKSTRPEKFCVFVDDTEPSTFKFAYGKTSVYWGIPPNVISIYHGSYLNKDTFTCTIDGDNGNDSCTLTSPTLHGIVDMIKKRVSPSLVPYYSPGNHQYKSFVQYTI